MRLNRMCKCKTTTCFCLCTRHMASHRHSLALIVCACIFPQVSFIITLPFGNKNKTNYLRFYLIFFSVKINNINKKYQMFIRIKIELSRDKSKWTIISFIADILMHSIPFARWHGLICKIMKLAISQYTCTSA